jgi:glycosyltransferase involved in cell wall biosynthesis
VNIWIVYQFASTPDLPGSNRTYLYARAFAEAGNDVTLWTSSFSHYGRVETIQDDAPYAVRNEGRLKIISLKTKPAYFRNDYRRFLNLISFARNFLRFSRRELPSPDVIIASYPSPLSAYASYRLARRLHVKFVLEVRDLWPQVWVERGAFSRYHPFILFLYAIERHLYKRADTIVSALPYINDYLSERRMRQREIGWIPNAVNMDEIAREDGGAAGVPLEICDSMKADRQKGIMNVAYVGGLGPANRVECILEAAKILKEKGEKALSFTIVGEGHSKKSLMEFASKNGLDSVRIWPAVPVSSVPAILRNADVGALCLHRNPIYRFGVNLHKVYDYMAAGLPIVFSAGVRNDIVKSSGGGFTVAPGRPEEIASALQRLLSMSPEERRLMGERGRRYVSDNYAVSVLAKRYLDIIGAGKQCVHDCGGHDS